MVNFLTNTLAYSGVGNKCLLSDSSTHVQRHQENTINYQDLINYFIEIAFGIEIKSHNKQSKSMIKKWTKDIKIKICGTPGAYDELTVSNTIRKLNCLIGKTNIYTVWNDPNVRIYFGKTEDFSEKRDYQYIKGSNGLFHYKYNSKGEILEADVYILTDKGDERSRSHTVAEELAQVLGLPQDSYKYKDSIFYQGNTAVSSYSQIDEWVISTLYMSCISPGMDEHSVRVALNNNISKPPTIDRDRNVLCLPCQ